MSKRFTYDAIKSRLIERIKKNSESATILDDGAFSNLLDVFCEGLAEMARYLEYRSLENKWKTAQNMTSLTTMGNLIGRKRDRAKSAIGTIVVSHTDAEGVERLSNYGSTFFDLDEDSDYDDLKKDTSANYIKKSALVPWTSPNVYEIPKGTIFTAANGTQFISTKSVKSRVLTSSWSTIQANSQKLSEFYSAGGWDGIKYLKVPVIQGIQRQIELGTTDGSRFQSFSFSADGVENASNNISKDYFYVEVTAPNATKAEKWAEIQKIRMAGTYDKVYEVKLSDDGTQIIVKFGDGNSGKLPTTGSKVVVHYLETLGAAGNIEQKFQVNTISFPTGYSMIDPRTNMLSSFLSCINIDSIMGGKDLENEDDYKAKAPVDYLKTKTTAVKKAYSEQIMSNSPLALAKLACYPSSAFNAKQVDTTFDEDIDEEVANEVTIISNALNVSAIKANGNMVTEEESDDFIKTIIKSIGDSKGPNDSLNYVEPNFIKIAPSVTINTYDRNVSESEIQKDISTAISSEYSVFNTDFKTPLYSSRISYLASLFNFTDSVDVQLEALANVDMDKDSIKVMEITYTSKEDSNQVTEPIVAIPFNFDKTFASNLYSLGFKNYSVNSPYLLKVDMVFKNTTTSDSKNRTFFLYDNRTSDDYTLLESVDNDLDNVKFRKDTTAQIKNCLANLGYSIQYFDETSENYNSRTVRVAQFPYISSITDDTYMGKVKNFSTAPFENRPYEIDTDGKNKEYNVSDVETESLRIAFDGSSAANMDINVCYKKNEDYYNFVDIIFNEYYNQPDSIDYASGYFVIPVKYFGFGNELQTYSEDNATSYVALLSELLQNYVEIKVYARPKQTDIEPQNANDICFVDDDDIRVERVIKTQD